MAQQPRGILKTSVSIAARKEIERAALLESTRREVVLKVVVAGARGCVSEPTHRRSSGRACRMVAEQAQ